MIAVVTNGYLEITKNLFVVVVVKAHIGMFQRKRMTDKRKQMDNLLNEKFEIEEKVLEDLRTLIDANWDSDTVKLRLEGLIKEQDKIYDELFKLDEKE